ncbi:hypothetical protein J2W34_004265 [Variovorax boronicumulans]|uniref:hypothetical protein n=1 Tax=Variovorax TaxID=34072 RepID=UPI002786AFDE|nr:MULTISPECIES: hypothetical protein [Variovorax]MDQ0072460.1 hypothetical protein [Variovorax boronicumulans]MDQ0608273.1 hypothetical protein [Variovorax sp. W1I1]
MNLKLIRTILEIAAMPLFAVALFAIGLIAAFGHLLALPGLYLWERYQENKPVSSRRSSADP